MFVSLFFCLNDRQVNHPRGRSVTQVPALTFREAFYKEVINVCVLAVTGRCHVATLSAPLIALGPAGPPHQHELGLFSKYQ